MKLPYSEKCSRFCIKFGIIVQKVRNLSRNLGEYNKITQSSEQLDLTAWCGMSTSSGQHFAANCMQSVYGEQYILYGNCSLPNCSSFKLSRLTAWSCATSKMFGFYHFDPVSLKQHLFFATAAQDKLMQKNRVNSSSRLTRPVLAVQRKKKIL